MSAANVFFRYIAKSEDFHEIRTLAESADDAASNCRKDLRVLGPNSPCVEILKSKILQWDSVANAARQRLSVLQEQYHAETDPVPACENDPWWDEADHAKEPW